MGSLPEGDYSPSSHHFNMIQSLFKKGSYRRSFNGFAAKLTEEEAKKLASFKGVVSVFTNKVYQLQTTRFNCNPKAESNVIIGVLNTGIWPESDSFTNEGFGSPPKKWEGILSVILVDYQENQYLSYSKVIGARAYDTDSARDTEGHGSHTASTAAENILDNANFFGFAEGTARGVPSANILAGFDDAVADGVDILTVSLGSDPPDFYSDPVAIGAYHAAEKGIFVMQSAGNSGASRLQSVASLAPWILSVAASTTDGLFIDKVVLGNGKTLTGFSVNSFSLNGTKIPLGRKHQPSASRAVLGWDCADGCLDSTLVKNKIAVCNNLSKATT
ncbi:putative Subtilase family protein [Hibiscus syriacus]|uniref:Subtilase family protein n=1 Tax=Hibiscus syriacus TaxID=106335 RepID=A0A6A3D1L9_HIBSY|nr:putative Subtilase family protein [Hibiscus syriacus]